MPFPRVTATRDAARGCVTTHRLTLGVKTSRCPQTPIGAGVAGQATRGLRLRDHGHHAARFSGHQPRLTVRLLRTRGSRSCLSPGWKSLGVAVLTRPVYAALVFVMNVSVPRSKTAPMQATITCTLSHDRTLRSASSFRCL